MLNSLFNKVAGLQVCSVIKQRLQHRCFPVKFAKLLRTNFFTEHPRWLLLINIQGFGQKTNPNGFYREGFPLYFQNSSKQGDSKHHFIPVE